MRRRSCKARAGERHARRRPAFAPRFSQRVNDRCRRTDGVVQRTRGGAYRTEPGGSRGPARRWPAARRVRSHRDGWSRRDRRTGLRDRAGRQDIAPDADRGGAGCSLVGGHGGATPVWPPRRPRPAGLHLAIWSAGRGREHQHSGRVERSAAGRRAGALAPGAGGCPDLAAAGRSAPHARRAGAASGRAHAELRAAREARRHARRCACGCAAEAQERVSDHRPPHPGDRRPRDRDWGRGLRDRRRAPRRPDGRDRALPVLRWRRRAHRRRAGAPGSRREAGLQHPRAAGRRRAGSKPRGRGGGGGG